MHFRECSFLTECTFQVGPFPGQAPLNEWARNLGLGMVFQMNTHVLGVLPGVASKKRAFTWVVILTVAGGYESKIMRPVLPTKQECGINWGPFCQRSWSRAYRSKRPKIRRLLSGTGHLLVSKQGCGIKGFLPTCVQGNPPVY